ncbi:hypothetical protein ACQEV4_42590 [Streptomyces shenzhenensis]|uniref:hypothetical protein n=1 Tax=Streptomyces shenzhenensis TaxID=943815 RepID=UPI003D925FAC
MKSGLDTYLGWETPQHRTGCRRPVWDIGIRTETGVVRGGGHMGGIVRHACVDEDCGHGSSFDQTVVRLVCHSCGTAKVIYGEKTEDTGITDTSTRWLAYGLPPRTAAGLLLWPAHPWFDFGRAHDPDPYDFVVTRARVRKVTADAVVGQLALSRGKLGGRVWTALAVPDSEGPYGAGQLLRWAHANDGRGRGGAPLRNVTAAARWISARLVGQSAQGGAA